ncbi:hypothetical protein B0I35DRAFT_211080 [Stachybotrys elegans]|uniref:NAD(P)-binding domain-containing protein n=1 Tax=Stachybotrys elegans TaxID=80388 RepID=A0A8K0SUM8_9HYPO|nr:hypothetical protein B0I35DRAFT_211080 [Stachybotrys elegans]
MSPRVFLTGATGYMGGSVFASLHQTNPEYDFTLLVRDEKRGEPFRTNYPGVKLVYGSLDDVNILEKAAAEADIVIHTANSSDHSPAAKAIISGLQTGHTAEQPGYLIHVSGSAILGWYDFKHQRFGEAPVEEQKYHDIDDIERLLTLPDDAFHRDIDKIVLAANSDAVRIAVLCPPTIYGKGTGLGNTRSIQVPALTKGVLGLSFAPYVGAGKAEWDNVHIDDLVDVFRLLVEASQDPARRDNSEIFGPKAYYFAENGRHRWADVARWVAEEAARQGYLPEALSKSVSFAEITKIDSPAAATFGLNCLGKSARAQKFLGWQPKAVALKDTIADTVTAEAWGLGLVPKTQA